MAQAQRPNPFDETIESPSASSGSTAGAAQCVEIVAGSTPHLSGETRSTLRHRLKMAAWVSFFGFALFLIRDLFFLNEMRFGPRWIVFWALVAVAAASGLVLWATYRQRPIKLRTLRIYELVLFGGSALFLLLVQYVELPIAAASRKLAPIGAPWVILIFAYALFIPNTWRRAATVVGTLAVAPVAMAAYLQFASSEFAVATAHQDLGGFLLMYSMLMFISATIAIVGVYTIGSLRREAFMAKKLGQYHLKHRIGKGGMGEVFLAEHQLLKRPCAIKLIRPDKAGDPQALARFEREVRSTAKLSHWNTVEIFDYGRADDGAFYYVMEYLPGLSLMQLVEMYGSLPQERVIYLLLQACDALSEAHGQGLVHRDIKPGNIFAAIRGGVYDVAKLLDFGLAKPIASSESTTLTAEGSITGSPLFMSPEQAMGEDQLDARTDIYSLGAVAYFLLTGRPPFEGDKPLKVIVAHAQQEVTPPSSYRHELADDLEQVVLRCLAKLPEDRYQTAEELRRALADCRDAGLWNRDMARQWWHDYGCPQKRALDQMALAAAGC